MNKNILYTIVGLTFVAGMTTTAYAGPFIPTITLDGDVEITGEMTCTECVDSADIADGTITSADLAPTAIEHQYVPFSSATLAGTCDVAGGGSDTDELVISSTGNDSFVITGILLRFTGVDDANDTITITRIVATSTLWQTKSIDMTGSHSSAVSPVVFNPLGAQLDPNDPLGSAGRLPEQITSLTTTGGNKIHVTINCDAGSTDDIEFGNLVIRVFGWKPVGDTITASWEETPI